MMEKTRDEIIKEQIAVKGLDNIVAEIRERKDEFAITDKPFTVVKGFNVYADDSSRGYGVYVKADTYVPKENHPGVYDMYHRAFSNGKENESAKDGPYNKAVTWKELKASVQNRAELSLEEEEHGVTVPKSLGFEEYEDFFKFKKECMAKADNMLDQWEKRYMPGKLNLNNDKEKMLAYEQKQFWRAEKNYIFEETELESKKSFSLSFITPDDNTINENSFYATNKPNQIVPFEDVTVYGKKWDKSPIDEHVEVYTYNYDKAGYFDITKTTYEQGKVVKTEPFEKTRLNVSWDELKHMAASDRLIQAAHVKANGKFFPPKVAVFKNDKEFEDFKAQCLGKERPEQVKENRKGIHPKIKSNSKGMDM